MLSVISNSKKSLYFLLSSGYLGLLYFFSNTFSFAYFVFRLVLASAAFFVYKTISLFLVKPINALLYLSDKLYTYVIDPSVGALVWFINKSYNLVSSLINDAILKPALILCNFIFNLSLLFSDILGCLTVPFFDLLRRSVFSRDNCSRYSDFFSNAYGKLSSFFTEGESSEEDLLPSMVDVVKSVGELIKVLFSFLCIVNSCLINSFATVVNLLCCVSIDLREKGGKGFGYCKGRFLYVRDVVSRFLDINDLLEQVKNSYSIERGSKDSSKSYSTVNSPVPSGFFGTCSSRVVNVFAGTCEKLKSRSRSVAPGKN